MSPNNPTPVLPLKGKHSFTPGFPFLIWLGWATALWLGSQGWPGLPWRGCDTQAGLPRAELKGSYTQGGLQGCLRTGLPWAMPQGSMSHHANRESTGGGGVEAPSSGTCQDSSAPTVLGKGADSSPPASDGQISVQEKYPRTDSILNKRGS